MVVECREEGPFVVARVLIDELDRETGKTLVDELDVWIRQGRNVVLDMTNVTSIDHAALGFVAVCARRLRLNDGSCRVCCLNGRTQDAINLVSLARLLDGIYPTVQDALISTRDTDVLDD